jgi:hypothetical protein
VSSMRLLFTGSLALEKKFVHSQAYDKHLS